VPDRFPARLEELRDVITGDVSVDTTFLRT
jgi:hypothetical protein